LIRSFLAIELPRTILKKIEEVQEGLKTSLADVRWVHPEKIHLTLKFFGAVEESKIEAIARSLDEPVRTTIPFLLKAKGVGAFPNLKNPRVIWMGLVDEGEVLSSFQKRLETEMEKAGVEPEDRPFRAHLTLGRVNSSRGKNELAARIDRYREEEFGSFQVEKVVLFKSDLKPTGPIYTPLKELNLGGSKAA
jgi:2'-5' RNA ligase